MPSIEVSGELQAEVLGAAEVVAVVTGRNGAPWEASASVAILGQPESWEQAD